MDRAGTSKVRHLLLLAGGAAALTWLAEEAVDPSPAGPLAGATRPQVGAVRALSGGGPEVAASPAAPPTTVYRAGELRLQLAPDAELDALLAAHDLALLRAPGASGQALVATAPGAEDAALAALLADPRVRAAGRNAWVQGAQSQATPTVRAAQWHLDMLGATDSPAERAAAATVLVAVIDSGAAYLSGVEGGQSFAQAPGLAPVSVVAPWDFVENDALPLDEHMHGTHVATTILGQGAALGVAPGAALMPLRVLDQNNQGGELDLIDALHWAVDNGADVINLSLSFAPGYAPSLELLQALERAWAEGVVVLAASGNASDQEVSWPAASAHVVAVGAYRPEAGWASLGVAGATLSGVVSPAPYSNLGTAMGVLAPGGDLGRDLTGDGFPDGILAEAPAPGDPSRTGFYFMAGTSQAAAVASGVAARLLAEGVSPGELQAAMHRGGVRGGDTSLALQGLGGGYLHLGKARWALDQPQLLDPVLYATGVGFVRRVSATRVRPAVGVRISARSGEPVAGVTAVVRIFDGTTASTLSCLTDAAGACVALGPERAAKAGGQTLPLSFVYLVPRVVGAGGDSTRPISIFYGSDALEGITRAADANAALPEGYRLALRWAEDSSTGLGSMQASVLLPYLGTGLSTSPIGFGPLSPLGGLAGFGGAGLSTSPIGVVLNQAALQGFLGGAGLSTSPIGRAGVQSVSLSTTQLNLDGTGLSTSPIGLLSAERLQLASSRGTNTFLVVDGSGLSTSPIGFLGTQLFQPGGSLTNLSGVSLDGGVAVRSAADGFGLLAGTALGLRVEEGGYTAPGYDVVMAASSGEGVFGAAAEGMGAPVELTE
jgi:hypothetical protein